VAETVRSHPRPGSNTNGNLIAFGSKGGGGGSFWDEDLAPTLTAHGDDEGGQPPAIAHYVAAPLVSRSSRGNAQGNSPGHNADESLVPYTFDWQMGGKWSESGPSRSWIQDTPGRARSLVKNKTLAVHEAAGVRRLTPTECERLQGLPDGWTQLGDTPDSRRYSALGDAVTATVGEWIGRRLQ
jgi:site-specific DNA-cytosine methylase